jgi:hypothetical protein
MTFASPFEKRGSLRMPCEERGVFHLDGEEPVMVKLRDASKQGIGLYSRKPLPVGARVTINVKLGPDPAPKPYSAEICWCTPSTDRDQILYTFRAGLRMLSSSDKSAALRPAAAPAVRAPAPVSAAAPAAPVSYRVKGAMIVDLAKMVRHYHDKPWQKHLTLEDMKIINDMIIPAKWYPLEVLQHAAASVYEIFGQGKPESAKQWGRDLVKRIPSDLYASFFDKKDPRRAGINFININMRVFDFLRLKCEETGVRELTVTAQGEPEVRVKVPQLFLIALLIAGALEQLSLKNGGANPRVIVNHHPPGGHLFTLSLSWD